MYINEFKSGNYYTNGYDVYVMASGAAYDDKFEATNTETGECKDYHLEEFEFCTFHEAFRNHVNKIVLEAVTSQNRDSIWNYNNKECLAVSDFQKDCILKHYTPMYEGNEYLKLSESFRDIEKENLLLKERIMELTEKCINQQRDFDQRFCDMYDQQQTKYTQKIKDVELLCFHYENQKKFIQHLQGYIAAKHLESEGLILEKFIQEESDNGRKEST